MKRQEIRVDIIIPLRYNNGELIETDKHVQTKNELTARFGSCTFLTTSEGTWTNDAAIYMDINTSCSIITEDAPSVRDFFQKYKETLKDRYEQLEILITYQSITRI